MRTAYVPHRYQEAAIQWGIEKKKSGLLLPMGLGKTSITLTIIEELIYERFCVQRVLIIAPIRVAQLTWPDEIAKWEHTKDLTYSLILGTQQQRKAAMMKDVDIYLINRENVCWLVDYWKQDWPYDMVVIDELSGFKNPQAKRFKALKKVMPLTDYFIGLTGTPTPKGLPDIWSQVYLMDGGERLGRTLTEFRRRFLIPGKRNGNIIYEWQLQPDAEDRIYKAIDDVCMSLKTEDWLELPSCTFIQHTVQLEPSVMSQYKRFEREKILLLNEDDAIVGANAGVVSNKLLQFTAGAIYDEDHDVQEIHESKLDALEDLMEAVNGQPVIVFYYFKHDYDRIYERFSRQYKISSIDGPEDIKAWNNGEVDMLLVHPASAGHGLNLQDGGCIIIWYSLPNWNLELYQQANARAYRQGQKKAVRIYHLIAKRTVDEDVMLALERKDTTQKALIEALKSKISKED